MYVDRRLFYGLPYTYSIYIRVCYQVYSPLDIMVEIFMEGNSNYPLNEINSLFYAPTCTYFTGTYLSKLSSLFSFEAIYS